MIQGLSYEEEAAYDFAVLLAEKKYSIGLQRDDAPDCIARSQSPRPRTDKT